MKTLNTKIINLGPMPLPDQEVGNTKLNVMPFEQTQDGYVKLPLEYVKWEKTLNDMLKHVPLQPGATQHYITINSDFFTEDAFHRGEGVHMDGNFCVDPTFVDEQNEPIKGWGGSAPAPQPGWSDMLPSERVLTEQADNSHVIMNWALPYDVVVPIGKYVSDTKGGLFVLSSNVGTNAWDGQFKGHVGPLGTFKSMEDQLTKANFKPVPANNLVFMTSNTPHETIKVPKGTRRTFMRLTLNHNYDNTQIAA